MQLVFAFIFLVISIYENEEQKQFSCTKENSECSEFLIVN